MQVELVKWSPALKQELIDICNKVDRTCLSERMPYPYTEESADWWLGMVSEHDGKDGVFRAIVVDGRFVGNISVEQKADVYCRDADIGYLLLTEFWSKGIMTEAVRLICDTAFDELNILRITGLVYAPNIASRRVLEKNGFVQEGLQRNAVYKDGEVYDLCLYGKLKQAVLHRGVTLLHLEKVTGKNVLDILKLKVSEEQRSFVAGNDISIIIQVIKDK